MSVQCTSASPIGWMDGWMDRLLRSGRAGHRLPTMKHHHELYIYTIYIYSSLASLWVPPAGLPAACQRTDGTVERVPSCHQSFGGTMPRHTRATLNDGFAHKQMANGYLKLSFACLPVEEEEGGHWATLHCSPADVYRSVTRCLCAGVHRPDNVINPRFDPFGSSLLLTDDIYIYGSDGLLFG
eukprot:GHVU01181325.1.p1 GENE.GHVU01181325.1~~GHVU01181325.1.p1  ORF type:complete len:183 (-),score=2.70 GHVU01181325.1:133-681(-)